MRPKFRVWSKKRKNWLTPNDHSLHCSSNWMMDIFTGDIIDFTLVGGEYVPDHEPNCYMDGTNVVDGSPLVVQQYTGLKDKNGKEIYEGDIIGGEYPGVVDYRENYCDFVITGKRFGWKRINLYKGIQKKIEVVGNIFENSELL